VLAAASQAAPPGWASAYLLGCLALQLERLDEATDLLESSLRDRPDFLAARVELGAAYNGAYRWRDTLELLRDQLGADNSVARVELLVGAAYEGLDDDEQATLHYQNAARLDPADHRPLVALAKLFDRTGDDLRALRQYRAALDVNPVDPVSREGLFRLYMRSGEQEAAAAQLAELRRISASRNCIARCMALLGHSSRSPDFDQFRKTLTDAMEVAGPDSQSLAFVAESYLREADYERALEVSEQAVAVEPGDDDAAFTRVRAYRMTLRFEQAAEALRALLERYPNRAEWIDALVSALLIMQDFDGALEVIRGQLSRDDLNEEDRARYRSEVLEVLRDARRYDEWIETVERWRAEAPDDAGLRVALLRAYIAAERLDDALSLTEVWYEEQPGNEGLLAQLAELLVDTGRGDYACQVILAGLADDPDNESLHLLLIGTLGDTGRHDEAIELATNCLVGTRIALEYQWRMVLIHADAGRHDDAVKVLGEMVHLLEGGVGRAFRLDRDDLEQILAEQLMRAGRYTEAQARLSRRMERVTAPAEKVAYLQVLSTLHQEQGHSQQAMEALEQAYELFPLDASLNNNLAYQWADAGIRLEEAEKLLRYAVGRDPRSEAFLDSLGWVLYKRGDIPGAVKWLTLAAGAGSGDDPVIRNHLGDALWRMGDREQALANWKVAQEQAAARLADDPWLNATEYRRALESTRGKMESVEQGRAPEVAPLGEGVEAEIVQAVGNELPGDASAESTQ
jgi:tetratricopeptide (TPR) repeat protein